MSTMRKYEWHVLYREDPRAKDPHVRVFYDPELAADFLNELWECDVEDTELIPVTK